MVVVRVQVRVRVKHVFTDPGLNDVFLVSHDLDFDFNVCLFQSKSFCSHSLNFLSSELLWPLLLFTNELRRLELTQ